MGNAVKAEFNSVNDLVNHNVTEIVAVTVGFVIIVVSSRVRSLAAIGIAIGLTNNLIVVASLLLLEFLAEVKGLEKQEPRNTNESNEQESNLDLGLVGVEGSSTVPGDKNMEISMLRRPGGSYRYRPSQQTTCKQCRWKDSQRYFA